MVSERMAEALNAHDLEAFVACFHDDYDSAQPAHPDRACRRRCRYVEPIEQAGAGIEAAVRDMTGE